MLPELTPEEILRYSRHLLIPEVGLEGQRRLKGSSVLVIGTGGLGSPASLYLAAAGVGHIGLVDFDVVDASNLQRQIAHGTSRLGVPKVESARQRLLDLNPHLQVDVYDEPITSANAMRIANSYAVIVDCTDNFPTRYLSNDLCVLTGKPNVFGAIFRFDGQASVFDARRGPCYRCVFPEPPPPGLTPTCEEGGVFGVLPGVIGTIQATETLKLLLGVGQPLIGRLLLYNALELSFDIVKIKKNPGCKVCGENPQITSLMDVGEFYGFPMFDPAAGSQAWEQDITPRALADRLQSSHPPLLLDVREPHELVISSLTPAVNISLGQLSRRLSELDCAREIVVLCRSGNRSARALDLLARSGFRKVKNLRGGLNAWARELDAEMHVY